MDILHVPFHNDVNFYHQQDLEIKSKFQKWAKSNVKK